MGWGHASRCRAMARAIRELEASCETLFVSASMPESLCSLLRADGFDFVRLGGSRDALGHEHGLLDAAEFCMAVGSWREGVDWTVVDHYCLDGSWGSSVSSFTRRILAVDGLGDRRHQCDVLLNQNLDDRAVSLYDSIVGPACLRLLGPEYSELQLAIRARGRATFDYWVALPDHLPYFHRDSLARICVEAGWVGEDVLADFPIDWFLFHRGVQLRA